MTNSRIALIALTSAAVLGVAACGSDSAPSNPDDTVTMSSSESSTSESSPSSSTSESSSSSESPSATGSGSPDTDGLAAVTAAIDAAESETGGTAYEVDDQDDDGSWEIDVAKDGTSTEVEVSSQGKVTEQEQDDLDDEDRTALRSARTTIAEAIEKALAEVDGTVDDAELEEEDGTWYWQVSVDTGDTDDDDDDREVLVDVTDGTATVEK